jgi:UrcA family protein
MKNLIDSARVRLPGTAAVLLLACAGVGVAAAATPDNDAPSIVVRYGDLNLQTDAGLRTLYRRLSVAATRVCPVPASNHDLATLDAARSCQSAAIARATRSLHDPHLVEVFKERFKVG